MSEIKYFTSEGLQKLKDELDDLILRERPRIIQAIAEARDKGDLSENAPLMRGVFWWGKVDSDHRSYQQQIYSLSPLATREFPHIRLAVPKPIARRRQPTIGAGERSRTINLLITNQLLCH